MNNMDSIDQDIAILQNISESSDIRQRDLAEEAGLSLGMVNSILKRLVKKGWLQIKKINNKNIRYIVSSAGMQAIARKSYQYLKRTLNNVTNYKETLFLLLSQISEKGYKRVVLVGISDLEFLIEYSCHKLDVVFELAGEIDIQDDVFFIVSENRVSELNKNTDNIVFLRDILINTTR